MTFTEFAQSKGIYLLKDDIIFIGLKLRSVPYAQKASITRQYVEEWCKGMSEEENSTKRQNGGRARANKWIRTMI